MCDNRYVAKCLDAVARSDALFTLIINIDWYSQRHVSVYTKAIYSVSLRATVQQKCTERTDRPIIMTVLGVSYIGYNPLLK